jgi:hypothetical protein
MMGSKGVVEIFPVKQSFIDDLQIQLAHIEIIELFSIFSMGSLGSLNMAIQLRGTGRQDEKVDTLFRSSLFELGRELAGAIHRDGSNGKRARSMGEVRNFLALPAVARRKA